MTLYPTNPRLFMRTLQRWWNFISHRIDKSSGALWQLWQSVGVWLANSQKTQQICSSCFNDLPQRPSPPGHRHVVEQRRCDRLPFVAKRTSKTYSTPGGFHLRLSKVWERFNSFSVFLWPAAGARTCWSWAINFFLYFFVQVTAAQLSSCSSVCAPPASADALSSRCTLMRQNAAFKHTTFRTISPDKPFATPHPHDWMVG